jgi:hypothetical protein
MDASFTPARRHIYAACMMIIWITIFGVTMKEKEDFQLNPPKVIVGFSNRLGWFLYTSPGKAD